jgi:uncharacterized protein involved in exopolysaccharide biosynthesis
LKKELSQDYIENRSQIQAKPLRAFKTMVSGQDSALKDEMSSPNQKLKMFRISERPVGPNDDLNLSERPSSSKHNGNGHTPLRSKDQNRQEKVDRSEAWE